MQEICQDYYTWRITLAKGKHLCYGAAITTHW